MLRLRIGVPQQGSRHAEPEEDDGIGEVGVDQRRGRHVMGPRLNVSGVLSVMVLAAGCTGPDADHTVDGSPTPRSAATSSWPVAFGNRNVSLGCSDAVGVPPGETIDEVPFRGFPTTDSEPPLVQDVLGFRLPPGMHWFFRKNPLSMRKGAGDFTLSVSGSSQALLWVPAGVWTTQGSRPDLTTWAASSLTLHSCPDRAAMFLGGILAEDLHTCLQLTMRRAGHPEQTVHQRLDGSPCTE